MNERTLWLLVCGGVLAIGCDRAPAPPPPAAEKPAEQTAPARPTTQELIGGAYHSLSLPGMPLSVKVPQSWKLNVAGPLAFLEGPTPSGDVATVQLSSTDNYTFKPDQIELLAKEAKAQQQKQPELWKRVEYLEVGRMKILERLSIEPPRTAPLLDKDGLSVSDENGNVRMHTYTPVYWVITVYVPSGAEFIRHELNFMGLTAEQYATDRTLLEKIVRSMTFEPALAPSSAPAQ